MYLCFVYSVNQVISAIYQHSCHASFVLHHMHLITNLFPPFPNIWIIISNRTGLGQATTNYCAVQRNIPQCLGCSYKLSNLAAALLISLSTWYLLMPRLQLKPHARSSLWLPSGLFPVFGLINSIIIPITMPAHAKINIYIYIYMS